MTPQDPDAPLPPLDAVATCYPYAAMSVLDVEGRYVLNGGTAFETLGIDSASVIGRSYRELWDEETVLVISELLERARRGERALRRNIFRGRVYELAMNRVVWDGPESYLFLADDITDIVLEETFGFAILQAIPVGVQATDSEGRLTSWNPGSERVFGVPSDDVIGRDAVDVLEAFLDEPVPDLSRAMRDGVRWEGDVRIMRPDGIERIVSIERRPVEADGVEGLASVSIARDVTESRLRRSAKERERRLQSLGRVAGGVAHDFGNLLTGVIGKIELVQDQIDHPGALEELEEVLHSLERATTVTSRLLTLGDDREQSGDASPREVIERLESVLDRLTPSNISLDVVVDTDARVSASRANVEQILLNLVSNAADAMPQGGRISIEVRDDGEQVVLTVADQGGGIPPEVLGDIFDPFVSTKGVGEGSGLGLSVVHALCRSAGGSVEVASTSAVGTTIEARLPILDREAGEPDAAGAEDASIGRVILLVEDDPLVRSFIERALARDGHEVHSTTGVAEARRVLESGVALDVVITDVSMPGEDGITFSRSVRAEYPNLPLVIASGNMGMQRERHGEPPVAAVLLEKPFGVDQLRRAIVRAIGGGN
jgi:PAS domain S-box-containing protein